MAFLMKIVAAGAALLVVAGLAAGTAGPAAAAPAARSAAISRHATVGFPEAANQSVGDWYGYVDTACSTCHLRYVNANFKVPTLDCTDSSLGADGAWMSMWAGLDGAYSSDPTVEQAGVIAYCQSYSNSGSNGPVYIAFYEMVPDTWVNTYLPVSPGDSISASVYYDQSTATYSFYLDNVTEGESTTIPNITCPTTCDNKTAEVIAEVNYPGPEPNAAGNDMPNFGSVSFSGTTVTSYDGTKGDLCSGSLWSSTMEQPVDYRGETLAYVGALNTCSGPDGFTVDYNVSF